MAERLSDDGRGGSRPGRGSTDLRLRFSGDQQVPYRGQEGAVSLKVRAVDSDGNTVTQSVTRAYGIDRAAP